ncbi:MAG TPA: sigma-70 family RNA polymerase sigma factor [Rugosimonospora sp.]|nr:sigma-70 family RNA polymerase sigma factor [Rugosimonospora sp.]
MNYTVYIPVVQSVEPVQPRPTLPGDSGCVDDQAVAHLYDVYAPLLLSYLMRLTKGDRHAAEDILQETLVRAWHHPEARGADGRWTRPWLFTVARRIAIDHLRAQRARPPEVAVDWLEAFPDGDDGVHRALDANEVRAALADLPEAHRDTLVELYFLEHSIAETAQRLGVPQGTVKSRRHYALRALRDLLLARGFYADPSGPRPGEDGDRRDQSAQARS